MPALFFLSPAQCVGLFFCLWGQPYFRLISDL